MTLIPHIGSLRLRLGLALSAALAAVCLLENWPTLQSICQPLQRVTAVLAFAAIKATGLPIAIDNILLTHPSGFRVAISYGCTPVVPAIFLSSVLLLGLSLKWRERLTGLITGMALLTGLNLFRVAALYYIGVFSPRAFLLAHEWLGQMIIVLGTALLVCYWITASVASDRRTPVR